ncbi:hypothetical protein B0H11DRAFT_1911724 [Mycena galericulata]|nr:hypothetical protein B0H11DRAFT_1911724 [Mycena galericulata]
MASLTDSYRDDSASPANSGFLLSPSSRAIGHRTTGTGFGTTGSTPGKRGRRVGLVAIVVLIVIVLVVVLPVYFVVIKKHMHNSTVAAVATSTSGAENSGGDSTTGSTGGGTGGGTTVVAAITGGDGSTVTTVNGDTFIYKNPFGGYWIADPANPFNSGARPNNWTPALNESWTWGTDHVYGVNLGGWFVLEPFIAPALLEPYPSAADEWDLTTLMRADGTLQAKLEAHYDTFITEEDIATWSDVGTDGTSEVAEPFLEGVCWKYIVFGWARKYGIRVNLDLHTIPGSQNALNVISCILPRLYLTGVNGTQSYGGDCSLWMYSSTWNATVKAGVIEFALASMDAMQDWFFWTWKIGNATDGVVRSPLWSYQLGLEGGWMPTDPRTSEGTCGALGVGGDAFDGIYSAWQTGGAGAGTIAPSVSSAIGPWPPAQISHVPAAVLTLLPTYTATGSVATLTYIMPSATGNAAAVTPTVSIPNGWFNAGDTAPGVTAVAGCTYPDAWGALSSPAPTALCTGA